MDIGGVIGEIGLRGSLDVENTIKKLTAEVERLDALIEKVTYRINGLKSGGGGDTPALSTLETRLGQLISSKMERSSTQRTLQNLNSTADIFSKGSGVPNDLATKLVSRSNVNFINRSSQPLPDGMQHLDYGDAYSVRRSSGALEGALHTISRNSLNEPERQYQGQMERHSRAVELHQGAGHREKADAYGAAHDYTASLLSHTDEASKLVEIFRTAQTGLIGSCQSL